MASEGIIPVALMADLISALKMFINNRLYRKIFSRLQNRLVKGWGSKQLPQSVPFSVRVVNSFSKDVTFLVADLLTLVRSSSTKKSCCLIQLVEITSICSFFGICGHLGDIGPLVSSTSCRYLPSLDSMLLHAFRFSSRILVLSTSANSCRYSSIFLKVSSVSHVMDVWFLLRHRVCIQ